MSAQTSNTIVMRGRILYIKKSTWLMLSLIINAFLFIASCIASAFIGKYDIWFFAFCTFVGIHLIVKSMLFHFDSECYLGSLLLLIGIFYFYSLLLSIYWLYPVFIMLSFTAASLFTGFFYNQPFQYILSISLFFVSIGLLFYITNIISLWIFLAIIGFCVLLLVLIYFIF